MKLTGHRHTQTHAQLRKFRSDPGTAGRFFSTPQSRVPDQSYDWESHAAALCTHARTHTHALSPSCIPAALCSAVTLLSSRCCWLGVDFLSALLPSAALTFCSSSHSFIYSVSQSVNLSVSQTVNQSVNQSVSQQTSLPLISHIEGLLHRFGSDQINESINQSVLISQQLNTGTTRCCPLSAELLSSHCSW